MFLHYVRRFDAEIAKQVKGLFWKDGGPIIGIEEGKLDESAIKLAQQIVSQNTVEFDPQLFVDRYQEALAELIKAKIKGEKIITAEVAEPAPVVDLMAALKKSLETMKPPAQSKPTRAREPAAEEEKKAAPVASRRDDGPAEVSRLRLTGSNVFIAGRFERLPKSRIERELTGRGAKLHRRLSGKTDVAVVTHEAAGRLGTPALEAVLAFDPARTISEETLLRALGLVPTPHGKDVEAGRFLGLAGLTTEDARLLALFDVLTPEEGRYGFDDLKIAQHVAGLRRRGVSLALILTAATQLRRRRRGGGAREITRLDVGPWAI